MYLINQKSVQSTVKTEFIKLPNTVDHTIFKSIAKKMGFVGYADKLDFFGKPAKSTIHNAFDSLTPSILTASIGQYYYGYSKRILKTLQYSLDEKIKFHPVDFGFSTDEWEQFFMLWDEYEHPTVKLTPKRKENYELYKKYIKIMDNEEYRNAILINNIII